MSTKIYNAYRIEACYTIEDVIDRLRLARESYQRQVVDWLVKTNELNKKHHKIENPYQLSTKIKEVISKGCNDHLNFASSAMVYFFEGRIYVQFFGLDYPLRTSIIEEIFDEISVDYNYQNQSDPYYAYEEGHTEEEIGVLDKEYEERERVWGGILEHSSYPNRCGLIYELFTESDSFGVCMDVNTELQKLEAENVIGEDS